MASSLRVGPAGRRSDQRSRAGSLKSNARAIAQDKLWLTFADPKLESEYQRSYAMRFGKAFVGSVLGRSFALLCVAVFHLLSAPAQELGAIASFVGVAVDVLSVALFCAMGSGYMDKLAIVSASGEAALCVVSMSLVRHAPSQDPVLTSQQYLILGSVGAAFKMVAGIPKLSFLQFQGCMLVQLIVLAVEASCVVIIQSPLPLTVVWAVLSVVLSAFACLNSWTQNKGERKLWCMILHEREQKQQLNEQITRTNKLARTVMAMAEDNETEEERERSKEASNLSVMAGEALSEPGRAGGPSGATDFVAEFSFLTELAEKVKLAKGKIPSSVELASKVPHFKSLDGVLKDRALRKGFRFFCHSQQTIENLLFYDQVKMLKRQAIRNASNITKIFVREDAPSEVNIDHGQRKRCLSAFDKGMGAVGGPAIKTDLFDEAQDEIFKVMTRDIFPRFVRSDVGRGLCWAKLDTEYKQLVEKGLFNMNIAMEEDSHDREHFEVKSEVAQIKASRRSTIGAGFEAVKGFFEQSKRAATEAMHGSPAVSSGDSLTVRSGREDSGAFGSVNMGLEVSH